MTDDIDPTLARLVDTLPVFKQLICDLGLGISDREKYLIFMQGERLSFDIKPGTPLKAGTAIARAMSERKTITVRGNPATFGFPYIATAIPVLNPNGEVVGALVATEAVDLQDNVREMANALKAALARMSDTSGQLTAQSQEISEVSRNLSKTYQSSMVKFQDTDKMLSIIKNVAGQTNLLGVNAAIEAARVGDLGRGFEVVATEIRKLSVSTSDSVKQTSQITATIQQDNIQNGKQIAYLESVIAHTADAIRQLAEAVQETNTLAGKLNDFADKLSEHA